jgi:hypothetical protein
VLLVLLQQLLLLLKEQLLLLLLLKELRKEPELLQVQRPVSKAIDCVCTAQTFGKCFFFKK